MDEYLNQLIEFVTATAARAFDYVSEPWFIYQVIIAVALFGLARFLGRRLEPKLESRARAIKGHPGLLRLVAATLRRTDWIIFIGLLFIAIAVLKSVTWPSRSWLLGILLWLAGTWVVVAVLSRIIRNRLVARSVAWLVWIYAALVILGIDQRVAQLLDDLTQALLVDCGPGQMLSVAGPDRAGNRQPQAQHEDRECQRYPQQTGQGSPDQGQSR